MSSFSFNGAILELFSWLPAKSIIQCQLVSKDAMSYPSDSFFLKKHCENMLAQGDSGFLLVLEQVEVYSSDSMNGNQYFGVPSDSKNFLSSTHGILASSNGLVCGRLKTTPEVPVFICNPVTKTWVLIPLPQGWNSWFKDFTLVFECLNTEEYMLIMITPEHDINGNWGETTLLTRIYSPKDGLWKEGGRISFGGRNMQKSVYINQGSYNGGDGGGGLLYCLSDIIPYFAQTSPYYRPYVVCYDIETCVSRHIAIPMEASEGFREQTYMLDIFIYSHSNPKLGSTICLINFTKNTFGAWILDQESKWKMILKKEARLMGILEPKLSVSGFTVLNKNLLVIITAEKMYKFKLGESSIEMAQEICDHGCEMKIVGLHPYSNTLRSCGVGAKPLPV